MLAGPLAITASGYGPAHRSFVQGLLLSTDCKEQARRRPDRQESKTFLEGRLPSLGGDRAAGLRDHY